MVAPLDNGANSSGSQGMAYTPDRISADTVDTTHYEIREPQEGRKAEEGGVANQKRMPMCKEEGGKIIRTNNTPSFHKEGQRNFSFRVPCTV